MSLSLINNITQCIKNCTKYDDVPVKLTLKFMSGLLSSIASKLERSSGKLEELN